MCPQCIMGSKVHVRLTLFMLFGTSVRGEHKTVKRYLFLLAKSDHWSSGDYICMVELMCIC